MLDRLWLGVQVQETLRRADVGCNAALIRPFTCLLRISRSRFWIVKNNQDFLFLENKFKLLQYSVFYYDLMCVCVRVPRSCCTEGVQVWDEAAEAVLSSTPSESASDWLKKTAQQVQLWQQRSDWLRSLLQGEAVCWGRI